MEQDIITTLEQKVMGLIENIEGLRRENAALRAELEAKGKALEETKAKVEALESSKQAALEKIRSIVQRIEGMEFHEVGNGPDREESLEVSFSDLPGEENGAREQAKTLF